MTAVTTQPRRNVVKAMPTTGPVLKHDATGTVLSVDVRPECKKQTLGCISDIHSFKTRVQMYNKSYALCEINCTLECQHTMIVEATKYQNPITETYIYWSKMICCVVFDICLIGWGRSDVYACVYAYMYE